MEALQLAAYIVLAFAFGFMLLGFVQRSEFGIFIFYAELFVLFGAFIYPVLFFSGAIVPAPYEQVFIDITGTPGIATLLHILCYTLGAYCGFALADRMVRSRGIKRHHALAKWLVRDEVSTFKVTLLLGVLFLALFLIAIGPTEAVAYAAAMRSGIFDDIDIADQKFLFFKTVAFVLTINVCFIPVLLSLRERRRMLLLAYVVFILALYLVSVSRMILLLNIAVPVLYYFRARAKSFVDFSASAALVLPIFLLVLFFGKPMGHVVTAFVLEGQIRSIEPYLFDHGALSAIFGNFGFAWYSIEAGIVHFFESGIPLLAKDVLLTPVGFVPSRILEWLHLESFDYRNVTESLPCINAAYFGDVCTIPPRELGYAAYLVPFLGAFLVGVIKFYLFRKFEFVFLYAKQRDARRVWYPIFVIIALSVLFTIIPTELSELAFIVVIIAGLVLIRQVFVLATRRSHEHTHDRSGSAL